MKVVACLTQFEREWAGLISLLEDLPASVILDRRPAELLKNAGIVMPDLFLVDERSSLADVSGLIVGVSPSATILRVAKRSSTAGVDNPSLDARAYDSLFLEDSPAAQQRILRRAIERSTLVEGAAAPRHQPENPGRDPARPADATCELALRYLSRTLSAGFNTDEMIQPFLDLVIELAGVARAAVLMKDPLQSHFRVCASRGLYSSMLRSYSHPNEAGLVEWLMAEGRPVRRDDVAVRRLEGSADIARSFKALQATVCIPMAAMGELIGVLALGSCINGSAPTDEHVGTLFAIGGHVAVAIQNTMLHHEMAHQKAQGESVLDHMTNGVAAIDSSGLVTVLNRRAAEILRLNSDDVIGRDLRVLPAPLGDFLYAALRTGTVGRYPNLDLAGSGVPVDASTYPLILESGKNPVGSVLVVEDITERRALEESRRYADRQEIFNRLISQLAHEIKNPLVAVKTFADLFSADLFSGALNDAEFVAFIRQTVVPEIARLDEVVGKLVDFVNHNSLDLRGCDISTILTDVLQRMTPDSEAAHIVLALTVAEKMPGVRADPSLLSKALSYLLGFLVLNLPRNEKSRVQISATHETGLVDQIVIEFSSNRPWINMEEIDRLFDPLFVRKDQLNLGLPVARKIVQEHRGDVHALIGADESVVLRVTLPAADDLNS